MFSIFLLYHSYNAITLSYFVFYFSLCLHAFSYRLMLSYSLMSACNQTVSLLFSPGLYYTHIILSYFVIPPMIVYILYWLQMLSFSYFHSRSPTSLESFILSNHPYSLMVSDDTCIILIYLVIFVIEVYRNANIISDTMPFFTQLFKFACPY